MNQWNRDYQDFQVEYQRQSICRCANAQYSTDSLKTCLLSRAVLHNNARHNDKHNEKINYPIIINSTLIYKSGFR